jgi:hypothetical protein
MLKVAETMVVLLLLLLQTLLQRDSKIQLFQRRQVSKRCYFYKSGKLVSKGLVKLKNDGYGWEFDDLLGQSARLDRRVLDCIVGIPVADGSEVAEGSNLYVRESCRREGGNRQWKAGHAAVCNVLWKSSTSRRSAATTAAATCRTPP